MPPSMTQRQQLCCHGTWLLPHAHLIPIKPAITAWLVSVLVPTQRQPFCGPSPPMNLPREVRCLVSFLWSSLTPASFQETLTAKPFPCFTSQCFVLSLEKQVRRNTADCIHGHTATLSCYSKCVGQKAHHLLDTREARSWAPLRPTGSGSPNLLTALDDTQLC